VQLLSLVLNFNHIARRLGPARTPAPYNPTLNI